VDGGVLAGRIHGSGLVLDSKGGWKRLRRSTFQVNTGVIGVGNRAGGLKWDLVKRCDQPGKVLIQLESLILAQSERWRQA